MASSEATDHLCPGPAELLLEPEVKQPPSHVNGPHVTLFISVSAWGIRTGSGQSC